MGLGFYFFPFREKAGDSVSERPKDVFSAGEVPRSDGLQERTGWWFGLFLGGRKGGVLCRPEPVLGSFQIKFSVMQPGTHVWPHTGPTNCRLRMHLGLVIPKHGCRIRCTDQTR